MKKIFVKTENVKKFISLVQSLKDKPDNLSKMALVYGEPGLGKSRTALWMAAQNDAIYIRCNNMMSSRWFLEEFGGAGWVLFYKERWADLEIYNDLDGRLTNLFRVVKYHPNALKEELSYLLGSREIFMQFLKQEGITDIQKAARFLFLITRSFGGKGDTFGVVKKSTGGACKSQENVLEKIDMIHKRLDKVLVENRDFGKLITQYDHKDAFFYCDPPYTYGCGYKTTSTEAFEHERLRDCLKNIEGRFLLSYDDSEKLSGYLDEKCQS